MTLSAVMTDLHVQELLCISGWSVVNPAIWDIPHNKEMPLRELLLPPLMKRKNSPQSQVPPQWGRLTGVTIAI